MSVKKPKGPLFDPGLCRCCGTMKKCRVLNHQYDSFGEKEIYSDMLMDCFGLLVSYLDGKPTERLICATCVTRLREALSFRKQVLRCEEAFLQMKMYDAKNEANKTKTELPLVSEGPIIEVEIVKLEPPWEGSAPLSPTPHSPDHSVGQDHEDGQTEPMDQDSGDDIPLQRLTRSKGREKASTNVTWHISDTQKKQEKPAVPMTKVQQMMRERDPAYVRETNVLTIVEFSYVVPFKCRHNYLQCYYCGDNFLDPNLLRTHTETKHNPKKFKVLELKNMIKIDTTRIDCRLCPEKIESIDDFKVHISQVHKKKFYLDAKDSCLPFKLTSGEIKCAICDQVFPYFHALNKHMNVHFSNYVCETCGLGFVDNGRFVMHQQRHEVGDFPCPTCGKGFKAQYNRDLHIDRVHKKRGRVYCPKCDVMLMSYQQKLKHLVQVHGETPLSFTCAVCDRVFDSRRMLTVHRRKDHLKDYRYECHCCGQKFFTRFALTNHMPTHTGERNFKCKVCEKCYPRLKTLKEHMRIHNNDRRYRCHICGQAFIQNCSLKGHMKSQHPEYG